MKRKAQNFAIVNYEIWVFRNFHTFLVTPSARGKRMVDSDDFWAIRGKKANEDYFPIKRGLKPNGLFSSIKRAKEFIKRPNLKPNGLFSSFKRSQDFANDEDELYNYELLYDAGMF